MPALCQFHAERGQRRLQPVRQIGDMAAGMRQLRLVLIDQRVQFIRQRGKLVRLVGRHVPGTAGADLGQRRLQRAERT
jgi:hypothetical protein